MSNMSYCRFQNTEADLRDCYRAMLQADTIEDMDLSDDELHAMTRLVNLCYKIIEEHESKEEAEVDGQPDEAQEWHDFDPDC